MISKRAFIKMAGMFIPASALGSAGRKFSTGEGGERSGNEGGTYPDEVSIWELSSTSGGGVNYGILSSKYIDEECRVDIGNPELRNVTSWIAMSMNLQTSNGPLLMVISNRRYDGLTFTRSRMVDLRDYYHRLKEANGVNISWVDYDPFFGIEFNTDPYERDQGIHEFLAVPARNHVFE